MRELALDDKQALRIMICIIYTAYALACAVIGIEHWRDPFQGWIAPARWLVMGAVFSVTVCLVTIALTLMGRYRAQYFVIFLELSINLFMAVLGSIALWANNPHSQSAAVHDIVTATLIIEFFSAAVTVMCYRQMLS